MGVSIEEPGVGGGGAIEGRGMQGGTLGGWNYGGGGMQKNQPSRYGAALHSLMQHPAMLCETPCSALSCIRCIRCNDAPLLSHLTQII